MYRKYKVEILYLIVGGITFALGIGVYALLYSLISLHELVSNAISWICGVSFSYFASKRWVFEDYDWSREHVFKQMGEFLLARVVTLALQEVLLFIFITMLGKNAVIVKIITDVIIIALNYIISKFIIFSKEQ